MARNEDQQDRCGSGFWRRAHKWSRWCAPKAAQIPQLTLLGGVISTVVIQTRDCSRCGRIETQPVHGWPTRKEGKRIVAVPENELGSVKVPDELPEDLG